MIHSSLRYHRPTSAREVSDLLATYPDTSAVLGGGTQLIPRMTRNDLVIEHVIDISDIGADRLEQDNGVIFLGAKTTYSDVLATPFIRRTAPLLTKMASGVTGGRQLLQQATLVGSICQNYPGTDAPGVASALRCEVVLHGIDGERIVGIDSFLDAAEHVSTNSGEFVTGLRFRPHLRAGYYKIKHSTGSWPIATASAIRTESGEIDVTIGAVQWHPLRIRIQDIDEVSARVAEQHTEPWADVLAPASYRVAVAPVAARRAINDLLKDEL